MRKQSRASIGDLSDQDVRKVVRRVQKMGLADTFLLGLLEELAAEECVRNQRPASGGSPRTSRRESSSLARGLL
jgi:hypothetical protein